MSLWTVTRPVVGMVHVMPLPGAPGWRGSMPEVVSRATRDARILDEEGLDGILVENFGDAPFLPGAVSPETIASLAVVVRAVVDAIDRPVGVNVLRNDAHGAVAIALAAGARFIRVNVHTGMMFTDQGPVVGAAHDTLRARAAADAPVAILADVLVKHASPPPQVPIERCARDSWDRGLADGLIVSGAATGEATEPDDVRRVKRAVPTAPVWVGSGLTTESVATVLTEADGAIVGSAVEADGVAGRPVDPVRARALMRAVLELRRRLST